ncbi:hypothetical protein AAE02nite_42220 [Adhaeribacter aerolatus]|uniref:DUF4407 domain-containing protein n=1 Tax=Adhaeribacter aerolatus TaxID=670289 RepID=A0A512B3M2_9BACT|nr:DUF4407 domain-containing protein [Adhaeribacter aerolatus]GEO06558.1 hypothetical protein AAE02nite_42220 [Adhaeribacter aerolatus]
MNNWWIRFGCFLTGYNYGIVRNSSEVAAKAVKRYTSALLIVCILWSFIGYSFTQRYLDGGLMGSIAGAVIAVIIIIQIERQIILSITPSKGLYISRALIAAMMSVIGAVIIDQIIFKEDIDLKKIDTIGDRVNNALPPKTADLRNQIASLDTAILNKENERLNLIADIEKRPTIKAISSVTTQTPVKETITDTTGNTIIKEKVQQTKSVSVSNINNPKIDMIEPLVKQIEELRIQKSKKETDLINVRDQLEEEYKSKAGFLDELEVMYSLITGSNIALIVWFLWFFFLLGLELLVLISKANEKENDYEKTVKHHMDLQIRKLNALAKVAEGSSLN